MSAGLADVQARVAQLQALFAPAGAAGTGSTGSAGGAAFAQALDSATADAGSGDGGDAAAAVVDTAKQYLGVPYRWGGTDPSSGLDCSGLTQLVYAKNGVQLPRTSAEQARSGTEVASLADARAGDLVFFGSPVHHVGIYLGNGMMLDAPHTGSQVRIEKVWGTPSQIRRVLPGSDAAASGSVAAAGLGATGLGAAGLGGLALGATGTGGLALGAAGADQAGGSALQGTPYASLFAAAGSRYGVDPALLSAMARAESGYDPAAVSSAGARGLMQLMPGTARSLGVDPLDPSSAVTGAARLMADNLRSFNGRVDLALAAYNAGPGAVRRHNGVPPYGETRTYVQRVTSYWKALR